MNPKNKEKAFGALRATKNAARLVNLKRRELSFPYRSYHRRNNCIFIHIPKSGGTSILLALGKQAGPRDHLPWYVYYTANPVYFGQAYKFAFVRNPWSRVFSAYSYLKAGGNQSGDLIAAKMINQYQDLDDFVINGLGRGFFRSHLLFLPQAEFVVDGAGEVIVDFLGRFEKLEEDFSVVANELSLSKSLQKANRGTLEHEPYRGFYRKTDSVDVIANIYKQDILLFDYEY